MPNADQLMQVRFNLALQLKDKSLEEIEKIYKWVVGSPSNIVPVSSFEVVKQ